MGRRITIEEKIEFVKEYEEFGEKHISEKYEIYMATEIRVMYKLYKYYIETYSYVTITELTNNIDSTHLLQLIQDFNDSDITMIELCRKYKIRYSSSHIRNTLRKLCDELGIEYRIGKVPCKYSNSERLEIAKICLEEGRDQARIYIINKYGISSKFYIYNIIRGSIEFYNKEISQFNRLKLSDEEKIEFVKEYEEFGANFMVDKYKGHDVTSIYTLVSIWRAEFNIPTNKRTDAEKKLMIKEHTQYGTKFMMQKYNYVSGRAVSSIITKYKKEFGIQLKGVKRYSKEQVMKILEYYKNHTISETVKKFDTSKPTIYKFCNQYNVSVHGKRRGKSFVM